MRLHFSPSAATVKTRSRQTIGKACLSPGIAVFQSQCIGPLTACFHVEDQHARLALVPAAESANVGEIAGTISIGAAEMLGDELHVPVRRSRREAAAIQEAEVRPTAASAVFKHAPRAGVRGFVLHADAEHFCEELSVHERVHAGTFNQTGSFVALVFEVEFTNPPL